MVFGKSERWCAWRVYQVISVYCQHQFSLPHLQLYSRVNLAFFLLSSSVGHFSCWSMVSTDEVMLCLFVTYLADLLCIISSLCIHVSFCRWGSHTELAYSTVGLTYAVYAFSLMSLFTMFKFLLTNPIVLFAFWQCFVYGHSTLGLMLWWLQGSLLMRRVLSYVREDCS